ncbi:MULTISPECIES: hypothetical protein [Paenibacillus]|uniref:Uncharacterized protein n=1 Tax=Paenibacillus glycanilyticus TaxID=126569 RepID=A0ABQ6NDI6_9BACL|nr:MULTISPECIES: hypothetical protein [Paenibacillus]ACT02457.1 hypothetical protein Pjdr2_3827 [Paenibacillus sp. JDR-2]GMK43048.1 hypothetical protein PghCCS26_01750 [Paenibacillus glycanilyticus]
MAQEYAYMAVWLLGLFGIVGTVIACVARFVVKDSLSYDQTHVWRRKLPPETKKK